jgi:uncharacterized protein
MIDGMLAIDAHCHIGEFKGERHGLRSFSADSLIEHMDRNGIDKAVVAHLIFPLWEQEEFKKANNLIIQATWNYPDRLVGLCAVNPKHGSFAQQEVRRCLEAGLKGIKVQPAMHGGYAIDGPLLEPIMKRAADAKVPLVTHSDFNARSCTPYQVARLAARYPQVTVVMLHLGIEPDMIVQTPEIVMGVRNLVVETSQTPDLPHAVFVNPVRRLGADRVLFGSDGPFFSVETNLTKLAVAEASYGLSKDEKRRVLGENAARVFNIPL